MLCSVVYADKYADVYLILVCGDCDKCKIQFYDEIRDPYESFKF